MNSSLRACFTLFSVIAGLAACHKSSRPVEADMDAEARRKAIEVREAADKEAAAVTEAAAAKEADRKKAEVREALAPGSTVPAAAPSK